MPAALGWTTDSSVTVATSTDMSAATRLHVLHNWSWDEAFLSREAIRPGAQRAR
jgi:hypothetical protein